MRPLLKARDIIKLNPVFLFPLVYSWISCTPKDLNSKLNLGLDNSRTGHVKFIGCLVISLLFMMEVDRAYRVRCSCLCCVNKYANIRDTCVSSLLFTAFGPFCMPSEFHNSVLVLLSPLRGFKGVQSYILFFSNC